MAHAVVVALPRSEALVRRLDDLRAHARDSAAAYRETATQMRRAREGYEREVWQSGAADLVRSTMVDADGRFTLSDLPAGRWMVWATHSEFLDARSPKFQPAIASGIGCRPGWSATTRNGRGCARWTRRPARRRRWS